MRSASLRERVGSWLLALPFVLAGEGLRIWAAGHLHKTRELAISGPYSHVRHPLYLGTLLIGSGFCLMLGGVEALVALLAWLGVYFGSYLPRKERRETDRLARRHGEVYTAYRSEVPALLPRLSAWKAPGGETDGRWSFGRVHENDELGTAFTVALLLFVLTVKVGACGSLSAQTSAGRWSCSVVQLLDRAESRVARAPRPPLEIANPSSMPEERR